MTRILIPLAITSLLLISSCAKKEAPTADRPHATVLMRDGTKLSGAVVESSAAEIKIAGDDNVTHTIPMSQVKQIDYGEAPATQANAPANPEPVAPAQPGTQQAPSRPQASKPAPATRPHPTEAEITTRTYTLAAGTELPVRTEEPIDSTNASEGQTYAAELTGDARDAEGNVVIPRGASARVVIRSASKGGKIRGASDLVLDLASVTVGGRRYELSTTDLEQRGHAGVGANKRTGEFVGGGAAIGAIVGAIAGGGKGAAIGAGSGAGAGALTQILTKGRAIKVPAESVLTFKLDQPLHVVAR